MQAFLYMIVVCYNVHIFFIYVVTVIVSGDSDSSATGAVVGGILGALFGIIIIIIFLLIFVVWLVVT